MVKKKEITSTVNLICDAGSAAPSAKLGQALGPKGVNMMQFCKNFNEITKSLEKGSPIPTTVSIYKDKSFSLIIKMPTLTYYIKKYAKVSKGSKTPGKEIAGMLSMEDCQNIVNQKKQDFNTDDDQQAIKIVIGAAKSMGIELKK